MTAIILAAGFSTRLYPLTEKMPKGLLDMGGKQIASFAADDLVSQKEIGKKYLITSSCFASAYRKWIDTNYPDSIELLENGVTCSDDKLGAIGDLLYAIREKGIVDDLLVMPSDTLTSLKLKEFLAVSKGRDGVTTAVFKTDDTLKIAGRLGCAVLDSDRITRFVEKPENPPSSYMAVPYYFFPKKTLPLIIQYGKGDNALDSPGSILAWLTGKVPVYAYEVRGFYHDVGTPQDYGSLKNTWGTISPTDHIIL